MILRGTPVVVAGTTETKLANSSDYTSQRGFP